MPHRGEDLEELKGFFSNACDLCSEFEQYCAVGEGKKQLQDGKIPGKSGE